MPKTITSEVTDGVTETFETDGETIAVRHSQDTEPVMDHVAAANLAGVRDIDGLGRPTFEVPITVAMEFCNRRGIPWEKFLYTKEFDGEWVRFGQEYSRLRYNVGRKLF